MKTEREGMVSRLKETGNKGLALRRGTARAGSYRRFGATHRQLRRAAQPVIRAEIKEKVLKSLREELEKAAADPSSGPYRFLDILCVHDLIEADMKKREVDVLDVSRACNQGRALELKAARVRSQNQVAAVQTELLRLRSRLLKDEIAQIREKTVKASKAKTAEKPFDYERALNQISAVIGLRGGEEFQHDEQQPRPNQVTSGE